MSAPLSRGRLILSTGGSGRLAAELLAVRLDGRLRQGEIEVDGGSPNNFIIPPGKSAQITAWPQRAFLGEKLIVDDGSTAAFLINDLMVGNNSQIEWHDWTVGVPADVFAHPGRAPSEKHSMDLPRR